MSVLDDVLGGPEAIESLKEIIREQSGKSIAQALHREGLQRPLVIVDVRAQELEPTQEILEALAPFSPAIYLDEHHPVSLDEVKEAGAVYLAEDCDGLVVIGSASTMDLGKITGFLVANNVPWADVFYNPLTGRRIPLMVAVPTAPGGAESSTEAFILDGASETVRDISRPFLVPAVVCQDERYLRLMPQEKLLGSLAGMWSILVELHLQGQTDGPGMHQVGTMIRGMLRGHRPDPEELWDLSLSMGQRYRTEGTSFLHGLCHVLTARTGAGHNRVLTLFLSDFLRYEMDHPELDVLAQKAGWKDEHQMFEDLEQLTRQAGGPQTVEAIREQVRHELDLIAGQSAYSVPAQADYKGISPAEMKWLICEVLGIDPDAEEEVQQRTVTHD